ncbi:hypothetical protein K438DRAFT_1805753 [Mycena galopus ATCC 62051]|nr:hypothetical protein K438DRAFT_1805753 [Mycena galopus ATCC 62051]
MGGKLPGLYGGNSDDDAVGCSGGHHSDSCYSARFMWRTNGMGELYTYLPPSFTVNNSTKVCQYPPFSTCNPTYGASIGRGSFNFTPGVWNTVSQRVQLNDVGSTDGEIQVWANGNSVIDVSGLVLRNSSDGKHRGMMMQTFFGGSTSDWASPKTQDAYFSDFSVAIIDLL